MQFSNPAGGYNKLLEVPLADPMQLDRHATVRITVALQPSRADHDPQFGLSDGTKQAMFALMDPSNYVNHSPCYVRSGSHDNVLVPTSTPPPAEYTLLFNPYLGYGSCSTAQVGGYVNTATFSNILDYSKALNLIVYSDNDRESYVFKSILVEFL